MANVIKFKAQELLSSKTNANGERLHYAGKVYSYKDGSKAVFINNEKVLLSKEDMADYYQHELYLLRLFVQDQIARHGSVIATWFKQFDAHQIDGYVFGLDTIYITDLAASFDLAVNDEFSFLATPKAPETTDESLEVQLNRAIENRQNIVLHNIDSTKDVGFWREDQKRYVFTDIPSGIVTEVLKPEQVLGFIERRGEHTINVSINS